MKYIYINDLLYFIKNHKKLIFTYILTTILYFIYNYFIQEETSSNLILETLTLNCDFKLDLWLNLIVFVLYISIHCFIALQLFINDFKNSPSNLFLRIDSRKWILCKLFSILTISILLLSISYIITIVLYLILINGNIEINVFVFIKNLIFVLLIENLVVLLYTIFSKYSFIILMVLCVVLINIFKIPTNIVSMNIYILLILYFLMFILIVMINRKLYINLFESEE